MIAMGAVGAGGITGAVAAMGVVYACYKSFVHAVCICRTCCISARAYRLCGYTRCFRR